MQHMVAHTRVTLIEASSASHTSSARGTVARMEAGELVSGQSNTVAPSARPSFSLSPHTLLGLRISRMSLSLNVVPAKLARELAIASVSTCPPVCSPSSPSACAAPRKKSETRVMSVGARRANSSGGRASNANAELWFASQYPSVFWPRMSFQMRARTNQLLFTFRMPGLMSVRKVMRR